MFKLFLFRIIMIFFPLAQTTLGQNHEILSVHTPFLCEVGASNLFSIVKVNTGHEF